MPYIDTMVSEGNLLNDLLALFSTQGWTKERYFKRTAFNALMINPIVPQLDINTYNVCIAEHMILKHPSEDVYYGFAVSGDFSLLYGAIPKSVRPMTSVDEITSTEFGGTDYRSSDEFATFANWVTNKWPPYKQKHTLYVYMVEKVHSDFAENQDSCIAWDGDLKQAALDLDVIETGYKLVQGAPKFTIYQGKQAYRSPVSTIRFRIPNLDSSSNIYGVDFPAITGNWFNDSKIEIKGLLDKDKAMFVMQADASASFEDNGVPTLPFYIGKFDRLDPEDNNNHCLMAGSAFPSNTPTLDYDSKTPMNTAIQPLLQTYPKYPSNGVDSIMVWRNRKGARYQSHVLYVETAPNAMEPLRTHEGKDYPRAWQRAEADAYKYQMNPSQYTNNVTSSYAYFAHADEGLRGKLTDIIVCNPISIRNYTTLKHRLATCPDDYEDYIAFVTEAVSPLSKVPGTPYHSLAVGISTKAAAPAPI